MKPLVSIIMNCFNGERYLEEAINSVYSQTFKNWEIIFWDNLSSDNSEIIIKNFNKVINRKKSIFIIGWSWFVDDYSDTGPY